MITTLGEPTNDVIPMSLVNKSTPSEEVNDNLSFSFIQINDDTNEAKRDDSDKEGEWDDGNEKDEEEGDIYLYHNEDNDDDENGDEDADEDEADN